MSSFLQPSYWFTMAPPEVGGLLGNIVFGVFVGVLISGIIGRIVVDRKGDDRYKKEIGGRISSLLITMGLLGVILFFFSFEKIQLLGARFWYPTWVVVALVWAFLIFRYVKREIPAKRAREEMLREQSRYLPRATRR